MRYLIADEDDTPQRFPLGRLLGALAVTSLGPPVWLVVRAAGYGERINELGETLDDVDSVEMSHAELAELARGVDEWFYDVEITSPDQTIRFGIIDSSAMFVDGPDDVLAAALGGFDAIEELPDQPPEPSG